MVSGTPIRYWYVLAMPGLMLDRAAGSVTLDAPSTKFASVRARSFLARGDKMKVAERRQLARLNLRTPLRFRALGVASDKTEHFTEALNVSRGGFFFASSAPLQVGMPIEATLRMPAEVTGNSAQEMRCTARVVHVRNEPYGDGRIGFGAEIEKFQTVPASAQERWAV
jgi:PilZ domain